MRTTDVRYRAWADEFEKISQAHRETEKTAVVGTAATVAGLGALGHVGANTVMKGIRALPWWKQRVVPWQMAKGVQHGLTGKKQSWFGRAAERTLSPEIGEAYHMARGVGAELRGVPEAQRRAALTKFRDAVAARPELAKTPILRSVPRGVDKALAGNLTTTATKGRVTQVAEEALPTFMRAARGVRPAAQKHLPTFTKAYDATAKMTGKLSPYALATASPVHAGGHMVINEGRRQLAKSRMGEEFLKRHMLRGFRQGRSKGVGRHISDVTVSPYANDARDIGADLARVPVRHLPGLAKSVAGILPKSTADAKGVLHTQLQTLLREIGTPR